MAAPTPKSVPSTNPATVSATVTPKWSQRSPAVARRTRVSQIRVGWLAIKGSTIRSEEHTSELQSRENLVCRLLLEKKKQTRRDPQQEHQHSMNGNTQLEARRS